ncbi:MAG: glutamine synthetase III [Oscillospiraceae bacterium]|nr:glutamine synthetase III [Oscillospiraceae bacterium]
MTKMPELFGTKVFNDSAMKKRLTPETYEALRRTIDEGKPLDASVADTVAQAMKNWAVENGATHYTHWFQPLTGVTAEKHESFLSPQPDGTAIMKFSGKALVKGESDASSFPSGGLRATFEARGYTVWDPTSFAFIKGTTLCIPTAFYSYSGEALDQKTPLLRSMKTLEEQAKRVLSLLGKNPRRVVPTTGAEQEYFLIDRESYYARRDLMYTGRTLFGAKPPKGQELDDHYYGMIRLRIENYMRELDNELWAMGVAAATEHNEVAPAQHELACIYNTSNVACDHNQLTMEIMRKVAKRNGLTCLFHEKPFEGVNGSGKHLNWSLAADGKNLLDPGRTPAENLIFLLFFSAVIKAVDDYQELLRISVASSSNDHRLGASEAPPSVVSIFVGDELDAVLRSIASGTRYNKKEYGFLGLGLDVLPTIPKDSTDRNRTSPFAFTGDKFEFRMPGASLAIAGANTVINTIVAESLRQFGDALEAAEDHEAAAAQLIKDTVTGHERIIFNGNGYSEEWHKEARRRGLAAFASSAEAIPHLLDEKNVKVFGIHGIYTEKELQSRCEVMLESYCKTVNIEAQTMLEMAKQEILPSALRWSSELADLISKKKAALPTISVRTEEDLLLKVTDLAETITAAVTELEKQVATGAAFPSGKEPCHAVFYRETVLPAMRNLRTAADKLEEITPKDLRPYPGYETILFRV